jgi:DNA gyrase/topoisomerase IV subunit B
MRPDAFGRWCHAACSSGATLGLQVKISHADSAEETFSTLMGDLVEPRPDFIQANALRVANLDV